VTSYVHKHVQIIILI